MGKGTFGFTLEQLAAILNHQQQQQMQSVVQTSTNTVSLPDSPTLGPSPTNAIITGELPAAKPANRCSHSDCKKKLLLSDPTCKCNARYCMAHRHPEDHTCSYDYKAAGKALLTAANPKVDGSKFEKI